MQACKVPADDFGVVAVPPLPHQLAWLHGRPQVYKVLAERGSGRLLGGQIVGMEGSAKRIDTLATALHAGFTVEEMINLDLGYAPPFHQSGTRS